MKNKAFIDNLLIPFLENYEGMGTYFIVHDLEDNILYINTESAKLMANLTPEQLIGTNLRHLGIISTDEYLKLQSIRHEALRNRKKIRFINLSSSNMISKVIANEVIQPAFICTTMPIFTLQGDLVATLTSADILKNFNLFHFITNKLQNYPREIETYIQRLTTRELEVVYLLSHGMSQREAADFLGITRGTVSRMITDSIFEKLELATPSSEAVMAKAIELGVNQHIPKTLTCAKIILFP